MKALIAGTDIEIRHINAHQAIKATPSSAYSMQKLIFMCVDQANLALCPLATVRLQSRITRSKTARSSCSTRGGARAV